MGAEKKLQVRKEMRQRRRELSAVLRENANRQLLQQTLSLEVFQKAKNVLLYASMKDEVSLYALMQECLKLSKTVSLPLVTGKGTMEAVRFHSMEDLKPGAYDILEVREDRQEVMDASELDLVVVPGVAFSVKGDRLGMGAGFYDRFLTGKAPQAYRLALTFDMLLVEHLPVERHDVRMDAVLTEKRLLTFER